AFLSNTAIVTMMIPLIVSWARTLDVSPGKLLMPLSFAAQLGGSCTLIGSSHCLVARDSVDKTLYEMTFFDLSYSGTILSIITFGFMAACLPFLASSAAASEPSSTVDDRQPLQKENLYTLQFSVRPGAAY
ncbi:SLT3, partial [Symbiodinium pilosum]